jgi:hypothetical protein
MTLLTKSSATPQNNMSKYIPKSKWTEIEQQETCAFARSIIGRELTADEYDNSPCLRHRLCSACSTELGREQNAYHHFFQTVLRTHFTIAEPKLVPRILIAYKAGLISLETANRVILAATGVGPHMLRANRENSWETWCGEHIDHDNYYSLRTSS